MSKYQLGDKVETHANFDYETNCALCAKPLGDNFIELSVGDNNELITEAEYNARAMRNEFVATLPIGSTCVKRVATNAVIS